MKNITGYSHQNRTRCCKNCFQKKVVHKAVEAAAEFIGNKITDKIEKLKPVSDKNSRSVEETTIPPEKREDILNELGQLL